MQDSRHDASYPAAAGRPATEVLSAENGHQDIPLRFGLVNKLENLISKLFGRNRAGDDVGTPEWQENYNTQNHSKSSSASEWSDLGVSYLAGPEFRGRYRDEVIGADGRLSIGMLKEFLSTGRGETELAQLFNTPRRRLRAKQAVARFEDMVIGWTEDRRHDPRVTWIVPDSMGSNDLSTELDSLSEFLQYPDGSAVYWRDLSPGMDQWLPWLSLELVQRIHSMTSTDLGLLRRTLFKVGKELGLSEDLYPWTSEFPNNLAELPIYTLYQFEPTTQALRILNTLTAVFCQNVGHLAAFDPLAWDAIHSLERGCWTRLALELNRPESQPPAD